MWHCSRAEPSSILTGINESLDHLRLDKIAVELVKFIQPEIVAVKVCVGCIVGIPAQITEVFRQDESAIGFLLDQSRIFCDSDRKSTRLNSSHQIISYAVF